MLQKAPRLQRRKVESLARLVTEPLLLASLVRSHLLGAELVGDLHEAVHDLHHACVGTSGERSEVAGAVFAANAVLCVAGLEPLRLFSTVEVPRQQLRRLLDLVGHFWWVLAPCWPECTINKVVCHIHIVYVALQPRESPYGPG